MTKAERIRNTQLFLFDMDGTLYLDNELYDFTIELLKTIRATGRRYLFVTNNSSKSVKDYIVKLERLGIAATYEDFLTSSQAAAFYLKIHHADARLYVCGTESLKEELRREGFIVTTDLDETDCIVMGNDTELTFQKLYDVSKLLLTRPEIPYIATNLDYVCPTSFGCVPDCGSFCDMLYNVSKRRPFSVGKPSPLMPQLAMERTGFSKNQTAMIGDRIYTDVKSGLNAGVLAVLVMSGETTQEILDASKDRPDLVLQSAAEILDVLRDET
jgi:HAD superfamily hydrolase (TIGR01450 family)